MSIAQLQSINRRKLEERAKAHERRTRGMLPDLASREASWMNGYLACVQDLREIASGGGTPPELADNITQWLEEQP